ncbi:hypothetical protein D3C81_779450 [compost metagenome]
MQRLHRIRLGDRTPPRVSSTNVPAAATYVVGSAHARMMPRSRPRSSDRFPHVRIPPPGPRTAPVPTVHRAAGRRPGNRHPHRDGAVQHRWPGCGTALRYSRPTAGRCAARLHAPVRCAGGLSEHADQGRDLATGQRHAVSRRGPRTSAARQRPERAPGKRRCGDAGGRCGGPDGRCDRHRYPQRGRRPRAGRRGQR